MKKLILIFVLITTNINAKVYKTTAIKSKTAGNKWSLLSICQEENYKNISDLKSRLKNSGNGSFIPSGAYQVNYRGQTSNHHYYTTKEGCILGIQSICSSYKTKDCNILTDKNKKDYYWQNTAWGCFSDISKIPGLIRSCNSKKLSKPDAFAYFCNENNNGYLFKNKKSCNSFKYQNPKHLLAIKSKKTRQKEFRRAATPLDNQWKKLKCRSIPSFRVVQKLDSNKYEIDKFFLDNFRKFKDSAVLITTNSSFKKKGKQYMDLHVEYIDTKKMQLKNGFSRETPIFRESSSCKSINDKIRSLKTKYKLD